MYRVILIFGDTEDMAMFLLSEEMRGVDVDSHEFTLSGILTKNQIDKACKKYGAYIRAFQEILKANDQ